VGKEKEEEGKSVTDLTLETDRLRLRSYQPSDWERIHLYASQPDFSRYEMWGPNSEADTKNFVAEMREQAEEKDRYEFDFAICLKDSGLLIGGCGIRRESPGSVVANLGWAVNPDFQKQGYATEAARALLRFGFEELGLALVYATCDARNRASYRVMEKIGMKCAGRIEGHMEQKGEMRSSYRYEILR
jgi:RimJ/RimL family protein N-acetyltransferase